MTETNQRSDRAQGIIDSRLSQYFSDAQLSPLTDAEIEILSEYFSNQQYKELKNAPAEIIKSLTARHVKGVERQRLTNIPEDDLQSMLAYYSEVADEVEEVVCNNCKNVIAIEIKHPAYDSTKYFNNPNLHWQGRFVIAVGNRLQGYRKRHDDVMGYRCGCLIENPEYIAAKATFEKDHAAYEEAVRDYQAEYAIFAPKLKKYNKKFDGVEKHSKEYNKLMNNLPSPPERPPLEPVMPPINRFIACGNESVMAPIEIEAVPPEHLEQSVITESDIQKIKQRINETDYKKPVKKVKTGYELDGKFTLRKVK